MQILEIQFIEKGVCIEKEVNGPDTPRQYLLMLFD